MVRFCTCSKRHPSTPQHSIDHPSNDLGLHASCFGFREENKESQLKAAESSLKLGEVSLETEQYEQAINDLEACLKIQKEHLDSFDRAVAETYPWLIFVFTQDCDGCVGLPWPRTFKN